MVMRTGQIVCITAVVCEALAMAFIVGAHSPYIRKGGYTKEGFWYRCYDDGATVGCWKYKKWPLMWACICMAFAALAFHITALVVMCVGVAFKNLFQSKTMFILTVTFLGTAVLFSMVCLGLVLGNYDGHTRRYNKKVRQVFDENRNVGDSLVPMVVPFEVTFVTNGGFTSKGIAIRHVRYEDWKQKYHLAFYGILLSILFSTAALIMIAVAYECCAVEWA